MSKTKDPQVMQGPSGSETLTEKLARQNKVVIDSIDGEVILLRETMAKRRFWTKRPMGYGNADLDRGQIFDTFGGNKNDEKLIKYGYISEVPKHILGAECGKCGARFYDATMLDGHGKKRHSGRKRNVIQEDLDLDREEDMLIEVAPVGPV